MAVYKGHGWILAGLALLLLAAAILACCTGAVEISYTEWAAILGYKLGLVEATDALKKEPVLLIIRLPRVVLGILTGATLGISGAAMQGLFRNPLAEPGLVGISAGAALFASGMIVLGDGMLKGLSSLLGHYGPMLAAFTGAGLATVVVYRLSVVYGRAVIATLLLAGIAINALAGSFTGLLTYLSTEEELRNITFWTMGSLGGATWQTIVTLLPFTLIPIIGIPLLAKALNAFSLGEQQAAYLGVRVGRVKKSIIVLATLGVGASVAVTGMIGFVGLIVPHILRMCFGADHRLVLPGSALLGAVVLTLSDVTARTLVAPAELPIGILTALIGTPVFIYIIFRERKRSLVNSR